MSLSSLTRRAAQRAPAPRAGRPRRRAPLGAAFVLALAAQTAQAAEPATPPCPAASDLAGAGITLTRDAPQMAMAYRFEDGALTSYRADDAATGLPPKRETYAHPLAVTLQEMSGRRFELRYDGDPQSLANLPETGEWQSKVTLVIDGESERNGTVTYRYLGTGEVHIGACSYPAWQVVERIDMGKLQSAFLKEYAPDPGLVLRVTRLDPETGTPQSQVAFDAIAARKKKN